MAPVAVVGAGLAGSLLALSLASRGVGTTLIGIAGNGATGLSYGAMASRSSARAWRRLERLHGSLGWHPSRLLLHGWPPPLAWMPLALQSLATAGVPLSRVDARELSQQLPLALAAAGVRCLAASVATIRSAPQGWQLGLAQGETLEASQLVLAAGAGCRLLWPALPGRLRFSWAGVLVLDPATLNSLAASPGWLRHGRGGGIVQPLRWQRPALEASATTLGEEAWIVDAGLAPWGQALLLGQISLVGPDLDLRRPPDPALMEQRLRQGLARLDPALASLPGHYRQVAVPFCADGQPLAAAVQGAPGLWAFTGFSGAFSLVPSLAEQLARELQLALG
ncbi:MAG: FAD-dependent oxidoreductase [Cyanobium sp.]